MKRLILTLLIATTSLYSYGGRATSAEKALQEVLEKNSEVLPEASNDVLEAAVAPCITQAKDSFREVRARFERGLPSGSLLLVYRRPPSEGKSWEMGLHLVESFSGSLVESYEWMGTVQQSRSYKRVDFPVAEVIDWILACPNASIEGNRVAACLKKLKDEKRGTP